tara:strand:+ start:191 stop:466 length:276 start_codon:yes stop_codon:yes gene_type:complete
MDRKSFFIGALCTAVLALSIQAINPSTGQNSQRYEMHTLKDAERIMIFDHKTGDVDYKNIEGEINTNTMEVELTDRGLGSSWSPLNIVVKD